MQRFRFRFGAFLATTTAVVALCLGTTLPVFAEDAPIVTGDIKAGIEKHIARQVAEGDG